MSTPTRSCSDVALDHQQSKHRAPKQQPFAVVTLYDHQTKLRPQNTGHPSSMQLTPVPQLSAAAIDSPLLSHCCQHHLHRFKVSLTQCAGIKSKRCIHSCSQLHRCFGGRHPSLIPGPPRLGFREACGNGMADGMAKPLAEFRITVLQRLPAASAAAEATSAP